MIKPQWFVNCHTMAKSGLDAVRSGKIEIIPQQYEQDWYRYISSSFAYFRNVPCLSDFLTK
jgi:valyl-tRNA synthetase